MIRVPWMRVCVHLGSTLMLSVAVTILDHRWSQTPARIPVHWGFDGRADKWLMRTPTTDLSTAGVALGIDLLLLATFFIYSHWERHGRESLYPNFVTVGRYWFASFASMAIVLPTVTGRQQELLLWSIALVIFGGGFTLLVLWSKAAMSRRRTQLRELGN